MNRSRVRRAVAATAMTRANQKPLDIQSSFPPAAWSLIPRSRTRRSGPSEGAQLQDNPYPQPHRAAIPYCISLNTQGRHATTVNSGPSVLRGGKRHADKSHDSPLNQVFLHCSPAALSQISRQSSKPILLLLARILPPRASAFKKIAIDTTTLPLSRRRE